MEEIELDDNEEESKNTWMRLIDKYDGYPLRPISPRSFVELWSRGDVLLFATTNGLSAQIFMTSPGTEISDMLQSLLQPRENQRSKMIGAMPAVAVRHERRRNEKRGGGTVGRRPSQLPLQLGRATDVEPTPSPVHHRLRNELYVCGKVAALHAVVGSLLLGIVVLVVGLVQLSPGAEAAQHRYYLMGAGAALVGAGILGAVLRCICLHWYNRKFRQEDEEAESNAHKNGVSVVESGHGHHDKSHEKSHEKLHDKSHEKSHEKLHDKSHEKSHEKLHDKAHEKSHEKLLDKSQDKSHNKSHEKLHEKSEPKPKLKSQASVGRDIDLIKQPSAASDT